MDTKEYGLRSEICEITVYSDGLICCCRSPSNCPKPEEHGKGLFNPHCIVSR